MEIKSLNSKIERMSIDEVSRKQQDKDRELTFEQKLKDLKTENAEQIQKAMSEQLGKVKEVTVQMQERYKQVQKQNTDLSTQMVYLKKELEDKTDQIVKITAQSEG